MNKINLLKYFYLGSQKFWNSYKDVETSLFGVMPIVKKKQFCTSCQQEILDKCENCIDSEKQPNTFHYVDIMPQLKAIIEKNYSSIVKYKTSTRSFKDIYDAQHINKTKSYRM